MATWILDIRGKFGHNKEKDFLITIGLNEKGSMYEVKFNKYLMNLIAPLFPNANAVFSVHSS